MLIFNSKLINQPIASVQAARPIAHTTGVVIDPRKLHISAFTVLNKLQAQELVLHTQDVREFTAMGIIIDNDDQLMELSGLVRLQKIIDYKFTLLEKPVVTEAGKKVGKVSSYVIDTISWLVMKLHVQQSVFKNFNSTELIIARPQIVKVTDTQVVVKSGAVKTSDTLGIKQLFGSPKSALGTDANQTKTPITTNH
jgi:sporulation protein YlmC with PRC-barrel domain